MRLYSQEIFDNAKYNTKMLCKCDICNKEFYKTKHSLYFKFKKKDKDKEIDLCSRKCIGEFRNIKKSFNCFLCEKIIYKKLSEIKKNKSGKFFCSSSCSAIYGNANRTNKGCRRSKLEIWLESQLYKIYPNIEIHYNRKDAIKSELDIYIPQLKLAIELNGAFHYAPIFGKEKLERIKYNDERKHIECLKLGIYLYTIDTTKPKQFSKKGSVKILQKVRKIINEKINLAPLQGAAPCSYG